MISKLDITATNFDLTENTKKYATKRIAKLDRYLPRANKRDVVLKLVFSENSGNNSAKYEISAAMEIPGGKVIAARDTSTNLNAGIDIIETKLLGQIRRFRTEQENQKEKKSLKNFFKKRS